MCTNIYFFYLYSIKTNMRKVYIPLAKKKAVFFNCEKFFENKTSIKTSMRMWICPLAKWFRPDCRPNWAEIEERLIDFMRKPRGSSNFHNVYRLPEFLSPYLHLVRMIFQRPRKLFYDFEHLLVAHLVAHLVAIGGVVAKIWDFT